MTCLSMPEKAVQYSVIIIISVRLSPIQCVVPLAANNLCRHSILWMFTLWHHVWESDKPLFQCLLWQTSDTVTLLITSIVSIVDCIDSGIVPTVVQMLDESSPDEFRAEAILVSSVPGSTQLIIVLQLL